MNAAQIFARSNSDDFGLLLEGRNNPQNIHFELSVRGNVDVARLQAAVDAAVQRHAMLRARPLVREDGSTAWQICADVHVEVRVHAAANAAELDDLRSTLLSQRIHLAHESIRVVLVCGPEQNLATILFVIHHAVCDGMGALRLATSVLRHYAGLPDPILHAQSLPLPALSDPGNTLPVAHRLAPFLRHTLRGVRFAQAKLWATGKGIHRENRFAFLTLREDELKPLRALQQSIPLLSVRPTLNDLLLALLHQTIAAWNQAHGMHSDFVVTVSPVNVRPKAHNTEPIGNYSSALATSTRARDRDTLLQAATHIAAQTSAFKSRSTAHALFRLMNQLPPPDGFVRAVARVAASSASGTTILSNLGALEHFEVPLSAKDAPNALTITRVGFAPPMPYGVGLAVGVTALDGDVSLTFRYRLSQLDDAGAKAFTEMYREAIRGIQL